MHGSGHYTAWAAGVYPLMYPAHSVCRFRRRRRVPAITDHRYAMVPDGARRCPLPAAKLSPQTATLAQTSRRDASN